MGNSSQVQIIRMGNIIPEKKVKKKYDRRFDTIIEDPGQL